MKYDSLMLEYGGGILSKTSKSPQHSGSATMVIGLGGTGVAALSMLKGKIYQQLEADNENSPNDPVPKYEGIQLLGIDSDEEDYKSYKGNCRLQGSEFFSICNKRLDDALKNKGQILNESTMNWMEIEKIQERLSPQGAGGVRQVGRFLLMEKVSQLDTEIQKKCHAALTARGKDSLDIYIFAGISGGTGSGCFLDICYIVRQIAKRNGWNAKIMGYFFLPDVVTSKPQVMSNKAAKEYNEANGYAAMKELDYLMSLKDANDRFKQNYGGHLSVDTQEPPVDMCHLISAIKSDGSMVPNGFNYGLNVATDYAMAYLANVDLEGASEDDNKGLTMRGHLSNVAKGVDGLQKKHGANLSYHVLGACNAEIPMSKINTYLACGFYQKFLKEISGSGIVVTKPDVVNLAQELKLIAKDVGRLVGENMPGFQLPDIDRKELAASAKPVKGKIDTTWATAGRAWLSKCEGKLTGNVNGLTQELDSFDGNTANVESLIGKVFRKLWTLSQDPNYGPYYAAQILHNGSYDLTSVVKDILATTESDLLDAADYRANAEAFVEQCKDVFYDKNANRKNYEALYNAVGSLYMKYYQETRLKFAVKAINAFSVQVQALYEGFFKPLCEMLDNLKETFQANSEYMTIQDSKGEETSTYTWQILTLADIKPRLDEAIKELTPKQLVEDFISQMMRNYKQWLDGDQDKIALMIRQYMLDLFKNETQRSLQTYLFDKYPTTGGDVVKLAQAVRDDIMERVYQSAIPMFWCDPQYNIADAGKSFANSSVSVPADAAAVCDAAKLFAENRTDFTVRKTGIGDRIFALRLFSGIPLFSYQGIKHLKDIYDGAEGTGAGVGNHLYALTKRGTDGSGHKDWFHFLPTPMPYSRVMLDAPELLPNAAAMLELYEKGVAAGVITTDAAGSYVILQSQAVEAKEYTLMDFYSEGSFNERAHGEERARLQKLRDTLYTEDKCVAITLRNDGFRDKNDPELQTRVRKDYFVHYPKLQQLVKEELKKLELLNASLESLDAVLAEHEAYEKDLEKYTNILFFKHVTCENTMREEDYDKIAVIYCFYADKYGDQRKFELSSRADSMEYGKDFPLYQGFLTYRSLDPKKSPRKELDEAAAASANQALTMEMLFVPYDLEKLWNAETMDALKEALSHKPAQEATDILRFYDGLRRMIQTLKDNSPRWPTEGIRNGANTQQTGTANPGTQTAAPVDPNAYWYLWDPMTGKTLVAYAQYGPKMAYDQSTGTWVNVHSGMKVAHGQSWDDLKSDPFFANI